MEIKVSADRLRAFIERQKTKKKPATSLERNREYRARQKALFEQGGGQYIKRPSTSAERMRAYRERQRANNPLEERNGEYPARLMEQGGEQRNLPTTPNTPGKANKIFVRRAQTFVQTQLEKGAEEDGRSLPVILACYSLSDEGGESQAPTSQLGSPTEGEIQLTGSGIKSEDQASFTFISKELLSCESSMQAAMSSDQRSSKRFRGMWEEDESSKDERTTAEDRFACYAQVWGSKLRDLPLGQAIEAERLINNVLHAAQQGKLNLKCKLLISKLPKPSTADPLPALFHDDRQLTTEAESADRLIKETQGSPDQISLPDSLLQIKLEIEDAPIAHDAPLSQQIQDSVMSEDEKLEEVPSSVQKEESASLEPRSSSPFSSGIYTDNKGTWTKKVKTSFPDEKDSGRTLEDAEVIAEKRVSQIKEWEDKLRTLPAEQVILATTLINNVLKVAEQGLLNPKCYLVVTLQRKQLT